MYVKNLYSMFEINTLLTMKNICSWRNINIWFLIAATVIIHLGMCYIVYYVHYVA